MLFFDEVFWDLVEVDWMNIDVFLVCFGRLNVWEKVFMINWF